MSKTASLAKTQAEIFESSSIGPRSEERRLLAAAIAARDEIDREAQALLRAKARARDDRVAAFGALEDAEAALADAREQGARELTASYISGEPNAEASEVPEAEAALERARRRYADLKAIADELETRKAEAGSSVPALRVADAVRGVVRNADVVRRMVQDFRVAERTFRVYEATLCFFAQQHGSRRPQASRAVSGCNALRRSRSRLGCGCRSVGAESRRRFAGLTAMSLSRIASQNQREPRGRPFGLSEGLPYLETPEAAWRPSWGEAALRQRVLVQVHEAGHACAIYSLGGNARIRLEIRRYSDGRCAFGGETRERRPRRFDRDYASIALAGIAAEERYSKWMGWDRPDADDRSFAGDRANIGKAFALSAPRDSAAAFGDEILARVREELNAAWPAVLALADALVWPELEAAESGPPGEYFSEMSAAEVAAICDAAGLSHVRGA